MNVRTVVFNCQKCHKFSQDVTSCMGHKSQGSFCEGVLVTFVTVKLWKSPWLGQYTLLLKYCLQWGQQTLEMRDKLCGWRSVGCSGHLMQSFQALEYQIIWWECWFGINLGKPPLMHTGGWGLGYNTCGIRNGWSGCWCPAWVKKTRDRQGAGGGSTLFSQPLAVQVRGASLHSLPLLQLLTCFTDLEETEEVPPQSSLLEHQLRLSNCVQV